MTSYVPAGFHPAFGDSMAQARVLHRAEGVLMCLRRCGPDEALAKIVEVSHSAALSTFAVADALIAAVVGAPGKAGDQAVSRTVQHHWGRLLGR